MVRTCRNGFMTFVILGLSLAALSMTVAFSRSASAENGCQAEYLRGAETEYRAEESLFKAYDMYCKGQFSPFTEENEKVKTRVKIREATKGDYILESCALCKVDGCIKTCSLKFTMRDGKGIIRWIHY